VLFEAAFAAVCLTVGVPGTVYLCRKRPFDPATRLPPGESARLLVVALAMGLFVWLAVPMAYVAWRGPALKEGGPVATQPGQPATRESTSVPARELQKPLSPPEGRLDLAKLPPADVAVLSAVPHLAAFFALLVLDLLIYEGNLGRLGFSLRQAARGLGVGALHAFAFVPLVFGASVLVQWLYRAVGYEAPKAHDLLQVMGRTADPIVRMTLIGGATLVAPLAEELIFRGHGQTLMRRVLALVGRGAGGPEAASAPPAWATWGAILLVSAAFASVHPVWSWPPIFLLSVCLGWVYERTGNLWAAVAVHALFNTVSTLLFLAQAGAN
jgi:membrane protease YdiL (CAAX protease family)